MAELAVPPLEQFTIPTASGTQFPVRRIYCIGRNYAAHAIEMGHDPDREPPFFFQKNPNAMAQLRAPIYEDKVVDYILGEAEVTDTTVSREELLKEDDE